MVSDKSLKGDKKQKVSVYTVVIRDEQMKKVYNLCTLQGFSKYYCPYFKFVFKGDGVIVVGYASSKLVVQGIFQKTLLSMI
jgi:ribonuclease HIII